jgi:molecular chaperone GrpE (heat shock protein)
MAKKKSSRSSNREPAPGNKRYRRTDEELISDLKKKLEEVKNRQEARKLKQSASMSATLAVVRSIDRALATAEKEGDTAVRHALADCRKPLGEFLEKNGLKLPKARLPRGRRPKSLQ